MLTVVSTEKVKFYSIEDVERHYEARGYVKVESFTDSLSMADVIDEKALVKDGFKKYMYRKTHPVLEDANIPLHIRDVYFTERSMQDFSVELRDRMQFIKDH